MRTRILLLVVAAFLLVPVTAEAQVTNLLKKKTKVAKNSADSTANKEIDKGINKRVSKGVLNLRDKILGTQEEEKGGSGENQNQGLQEESGKNNQAKADDDKEQEVQDAGSAMAGAISSMFGGGGGDVKHKGTYNFKNSIEMEMEAYDDEDGEVEMIMDYVTYFNASSADIAMDIKPRSEDNAYQGNMTMIVDQDNQLMLMLTSQGGQKMAIASSLDEMDDEGDIEYDGDESSATYTKNGKTKTIAGYKCDGYTMNDGDSKVDMWVTDEVDFKLGKKEMKKAGVPLYYDGPFEGGMIMEMEVYENDKKQMKMFVKDIKKNINKSISVSGYNIMKVDMGGK